MPRLLDDPDVIEMLGHTPQGRRHQLTFGTSYSDATDKITLSVTHDEGKVIFSHSSRDNCSIEMPPEWWLQIVPSLVSRMPEDVREECLQRIKQRVGVQ